MSWDHRNRHYQKFLKSLKRPESSLCSCPFHIHPRHWVPPPCLTSRAQKEESLYRRRVLSNPELKMHSSSLQTKLDDSEHQQQSLQHLYNEARILKEAFSKFQQGDTISRDSQNVIKKWSGKSSHKKERNESFSQSENVGRNERLAELDQSLAEAVQEEENLKEELRNMREMAQKRAAFEEENKKLKKKIRQLQHRIKRQDEAQRASHESLRAEQEMGTRDEYILLSLKKKYDDLLQYVLKVESENQKLKSLHGLSGEEDEFLHDCDRENSKCEHRNIMRLQATLESLRSLMIKKDGYIAECEERLQAMEALKEENLALHNSLKRTHEKTAQPDPQEISTALEDEWMRRFAETREMYERAIEGYRDQLQGLHEKLQETELNHISHTQGLIKTIDKLKRRGRLEEEEGGRTYGHGKSSKRMEQENSAVRREYLSDGDERVTDATFMNYDNEEAMNMNDGERVKRNENEKDDIHVKDGAQNIRPSIPEENRKERSVKTWIGVTDKTRDVIHEVSMEEESSKNEKASVSSNEAQGNRISRKVDNQEFHGIVVGKATNDIISSSDKGTQINISEVQSFKDNVEYAHVGLQADVGDAEDEIRESKEYLERVNNLVKRLESMKLNGEGAEKILCMIRDTINDCLHEWRESFHLQKSLQKDSADENKGYLELQRKLRSKVKQLESKQKQCRLLEEQNSKLLQQCRQLEAQATAAQASDRLLVLQDLPEMLHSTEKKLSELQEAFQKAQVENNSLQEQTIKLSEKLNKKDAKISAEQENLLSKEGEIENLQKTIRSLKLQMEEASKEVASLNDKLTAKDTILEHTSAHLEQRIRECGQLSSMIERQRAQNSEETRTIEVRLNEQESSSHKQLIEAQALASRYQTQLSILRSEKDHTEKSFRHNIRKLEEQRDQDQLKISTLQRQLNSITSTYYSMFSSVDIGSVNPPNFGDSGMK